MQQQMSLITLGVADLARSRQFYGEGFGWTAAFDNGEVVFYQMNGFVIATWLKTKLDEDMRRSNAAGSGALALAHNLPGRDDVGPAIDQLIRFGGRLLKAPVEPPHGGFSGYVADPDGHAWEIAWNPAWRIDERGFTTFGL